MCGKREPGEQNSLGPLLKYSKLVKVATAHNPDGRQSKTTQPSWVVVVVVCVQENQASGIQNAAAS